MVVPVTRDDVGYRPLGVTNAELMRILRTVAETGQRKRTRHMQSARSFVRSFIHSSCVVCAGA